MFASPKISKYFLTLMPFNCLNFYQTAEQKWWKMNQQTEGKTAYNQIFYRQIFLHNILWRKWPPCAHHLFSRVKSKDWGILFWTSEMKQCWLLVLYKKLLPSYPFQPFWLFIHPAFLKSSLSLEYKIPHISEDGVKISFHSKQEDFVNVIQKMSFNFYWYCLNRIFSSG